MESSKPAGHVSLATAESVVRSSQSDINETLMRSHLDRERGFVDERRTYVCPELDESAHTRVMSPKGDHDHVLDSQHLARKDRWSVSDLRPCEECGVVGVESDILWDCYKGRLTLRQLHDRLLCLPCVRRLDPKANTYLLSSVAVKIPQVWTPYCTRSSLRITSLFPGKDKKQRTSYLAHPISNIF